jgi:cytochrome c biogenesis protein CcmG/thiol:disulfide interchange protein DsbE
MTSKISRAGTIFADLTQSHKKGETYYLSREHGSESMLVMKQGKRIDRIMAALFTAIVVLFLCVGCADEKESDAALNGQAPDFTLKDLQGKKVQLKNMRGKVVLINFFATWCAPCRQEIPDFIRLYQQYRERGFEIIGIGLDMEGETVLRPFSEQLRVPYPVVVGTRKVVVDYGNITGVPTSFFIDRDGKIADRFIGMRPRKVLEKNIIDLLKKKG